MTSQTDGIHFGFGRQYVKLFLERLAVLSRENAPQVVVVPLDGTAYKSAPAAIAIRWGMSVVTLEEAVDSDGDVALLARFSSHSAPSKPMDEQTVIPLTGLPPQDLEACWDYLHRCSTISAPSQDPGNVAQKGYLHLVTPDEEGH